MRHPDEAELNDLVDGLLADGRAVEVEEHLFACERCRRRVAALRGLASDLAGLPSEIRPPRDLRPGIREEVSTGPDPPRSVPWLRAAAAVLLAVGAGAGVWIGLLAPDGPAAGPEDSVVERYVRAAGELSAELSGRRGALDPSAARALEASLGSVERAISELERARARDPADGELTRRLQRAHETRLELLRTALALAEAT